MGKSQKQHVAAEATLVIGEIYLRQGNKDQARAAFRMVIANTKDDEDDARKIALTWLDRIK